MSIAGAGLSKWEEASQQRAAFSVGETAELLGCCPASIYRVCGAGSLCPSCLAGVG
jgi:hypothetical protein